MTAQTPASPFPAINTCDGARRDPSGDIVADGSLSVRLTAACDSACSFCIAAEDMRTSHAFDMEAVVSRTLESGAKSISLLGGEPLLFLDRTLEFLQRIRSHVEQIYITTNLPITLHRQWEKFLAVMELADFITVSLASLDDEVNNGILRSKKPYSRTAMLERVLAHPALRDKVTVSMNLVRGGIDEKGKFLGHVLALQGMGLKHLRVNELMHAPKDYVSFEDMMGVELGSPYSTGCKTALPLVEGMDIYLKRSCFLVESSRYATPEDTEKLLYKRDHPEEFVVPGWRILYEHGEYDLKWRRAREESRLSLPLVSTGDNDECRGCGEKCGCREGQKHES